MSYLMQLRGCKSFLNICRSECRNRVLKTGVIVEISRALEKHTRDDDLSKVAG